MRISPSPPALFAVACLGVALILGGASDRPMFSQGGRVTQEAPDSTSFAEDVLPILQASCVQCHGAEVDGVVVTEVSLNLTTYDGVMAGSEYGTVVEAGEPDESMLLVMIEDGDMPQEGEPLPIEKIEVIRTWIAEGARNN